VHVNVNVVARTAKPRRAGEWISLSVNAKRFVSVNDFALDAVAFVAGSPAAPVWGFPIPPVTPLGATTGISFDLSVIFALGILLR
jgi:hypothetical protein